MLSPALIDDAKHDLTLHLAHCCFAHLCLALRVEPRRVGHDHVVHVVGISAIAEVANGDSRRPERNELACQTFQIPFVIGIRNAVGLNQCIDSLSQVVHCRNFEIEAFKNLVAALINDLALLVHYFVVLENILSDFAVSLFDGGLRTLDRFRDHARFNRFVFRKRATHHPAECASGKQAHQFVIEAEIEAAFARVSLTACTTTQLIIDSPRLVALGAKNIKAAKCSHLVAFFLTGNFVRLHELVITSLCGHP